MYQWNKQSLQLSTSEHSESMLVDKTHCTGLFCKSMSSAVFYNYQYNILLLYSFQLK